MNCYQLSDVTLLLSITRFNQFLSITYQFYQLVYQLIYQFLSIRLTQIFPINCYQLLISIDNQLVNCYQLLSVDSNYQFYHY